MSKGRVPRMKNPPQPPIKKDNWISTEVSQPLLGEYCLVYDEDMDITIQKWTEHYEEPVAGMGRILTGEGWEESEVYGSYWMYLPEPPTQ